MYYGHVVYIYLVGKETRVDVVIQEHEQLTLEAIKQNNIIITEVAATYTKLSSHTEPMHSLGCQCDPLCVPLGYT